MLPAREEIHSHDELQIPKHSDISSPAPQEFEFLFMLYDHKRAGSISFSPGSHSQGTSD